MAQSCCAMQGGRRCVASRTVRVSTVVANCREQRTWIIVVAVSEEDENVDQDEDEEEDHFRFPPCPALGHIHEIWQDTSVIVCRAILSHHFVPACLRCRTHEVSASPPQMMLFCQWRQRGRTERARHRGRQGVRRGN